MMSFGYRPGRPGYPYRYNPYQGYPYNMQGQYAQYPYMDDYYTKSSKSRKKKKKRDRYYDDYYDDYHYRDRPVYYEEPYYRQRPAYYEEPHYAQRPSPYYEGSQWNPTQQYPPDQFYDEGPNSASRMLSYVGPIMEVVKALGPSLLGIKSILPF